MYRTKKFFVVLMQLLGGVGLLLLALALPLPGYFAWSIAILTVVAFASSTHDIAADGVYIASLSPKEQAAYAGWCGAFYNVARIFSMGGLVWLAGFLQQRFADGGVAQPMVRAWMAIFAGLGAILVVLSLYHSRVLPTGGEERSAQTLAQMAATFRDVLVTFFRKPSILLLLLFIFLYRAGEGQVIKIGPLFLRATARREASASASSSSGRSTARSAARPSSWAASSAATSSPGSASDARFCPSSSS
jgi:PAT family beta-lactamase induction signal transducer AmpG